jgi:selenocysteine lyase/cysteine desulfurase
VSKSGADAFEDGTIPFLAILSLKFGFEVINGLGIDRIGRHTFHLARSGLCEF